jgi:hypothetical protein
VNATKQALPPQHTFGTQHYSHGVHQLPQPLSSGLRVVDHGRLSDAA